MEGINIYKGVSTPSLGDNEVANELKEKVVENPGSEEIAKSIERYKTEKLPESELKRKLKFLEIIKDLPLEYISIPTSRAKNETSSRKPYTEAAFLKIPGSGMAFLVGDNLKKFGSNYVLHVENNDIYFACMCEACNLVKHRHLVENINSVASNNDIKYIMTRGLIDSNSGYGFYPRFKNEEYEDYSRRHSSAGGLMYIDIGNVLEKGSDVLNAFDKENSSDKEERLKYLDEKGVNNYDPRIMAAILRNRVFSKLHEGGITIERKPE